MNSFFRSLKITDTLCISCFLLICCKKSNVFFMQGNSENNAPRNHIQILAPDKIKANAERCIQKLDKETEGYSKIVKGIFKYDMTLIQGYTKHITSKSNLFIPKCINQLVLDFYFGIVEEHEFSFYKQIETEHKELSSISIRIKGKDYYTYGGIKSPLIGPSDLDKLNKLFVIMDERHDSYRTMSLANFLLVKNDLKRIVMLHRSGILKLDKDVIFELLYYNSPHITRYLFENTENFDSSLILSEYLHYIDHIINKGSVGPKGFLSGIDKIPYTLSLIIVHSKNCYEKDNFLIDSIGKLESFDIYNVKIHHKRFFTYIKKIIQTLQEIYLVIPPPNNNYCFIL